jgi:hypothetical protein
MGPLRRVAPGGPWVCAATRWPAPSRVAISASVSGQAMVATLPYRTAHLWRYRAHQLPLLPLLRDSSTRNAQPWLNPVDGARIASFEQPFPQLERYRPVGASRNRAAAGDVGELHAV